MACLGLVLLAVQRSGMRGEQGGGGFVRFIVLFSGFALRGFRSELLGDPEGKQTEKVSMASVKRPGIDRE